MSGFVFRGSTLAVSLAVLLGCADGAQVEKQAEAAASGQGDGALRTLADADVLRRSFRLRKVTLRIVDVHMTRDLAGVVTASDTAVFALNGGFFDARAEPIGLALSNGRLLSPLAKKPGGIVLVDDDRGGSLEDAETFSLEESPNGFGIQGLPRLVVNGAVNVRTDDGKRAERVALCLNRGGWLLDVVLARGKTEPGPTLLELARYLAATGCHDALNLDGGPSAGVAWREGETIKEIAPRGPVRHAIVIHTNDAAELPP